MAPVASNDAPGIRSFYRSLAENDTDTSVEYFISLVKRRQIYGSKECANATARLLRHIVSRTRSADSAHLQDKVRQVGRQLAQANPKALTVGNIVRRVLGLIRDEEDKQRGDDSAANSAPASELPTPGGELPGAIPTASSRGIASPPRTAKAPERPPLITSHTGAPVPTRPVTSMFSIMAHPTMRASGTSSPTGTATPPHGFPGAVALTDLRAEVLEGIGELIDELDRGDEDIANHALDHISSSDTIFTYSSSMTVQRFLLKAASKRKGFTVVHAEAYPNDHRRVHAIATGNSAAKDSEEADLAVASFQQPLIKAGVRVIVIPDSAIFALMSRCTKCILSAAAVLANGTFTASAGTKAVVKAARFHRVPIVVLAATYKLSPQYPHDSHELVEYADPGKIITTHDGELSQGLSDVRNPLTDVVDGANGEIDLFITNDEGVAGASIYRVVKDLYREEDLVI
ncbi:putative translation initiation factor eIF-2B subunit beta [Cyphellophora attinorum]|uniref:Translation initiation factor eIF2B subunit beta n=1 Tax=Cyphellophora attinorum TaxID=1664694 RepID=A0A0N1HSQ8_9EURO|nr:putative translation initiation factor eIF-2B subunit beta [Phialophora attinorum]KPI41727.1 putative translation initiation factor eIF-2B subunit beta [Phialophora attinorum]